MSEKNGALLVAGKVVQIGSATKSGGKWVTISTGADLIKVFFGSENLAMIGEMYSEVKLQLSMPRENFITAIGPA